MFDRGRSSNNINMWVNNNSARDIYFGASSGGKQNVLKTNRVDFTKENANFLYCRKKLFII